MCPKWFNGKCVQLRMKIPFTREIADQQLLLVLIAALMDTLILISHVNKLCIHKFIATYTHLARYIGWACTNNTIFFYSWNSYNSLCIHLVIQLYTAKTEV